MNSISIGGWFVLLSEIIAYRDTGMIDEWNTVEAMLRGGIVIMTGRISRADYGYLVDMFLEGRQK